MRDMYFKSDANRIWQNAQSYTGSKQGYQDRSRAWQRNYKQGEQSR